MNFGLFDIWADDTVGFTLLTLYGRGDSIRGLAGLCYDKSDGLLEFDFLWRYFSIRTRRRSPAVPRVDARAAEEAAVYAENQARRPDPDIIDAYVEAYKTGHDSGSYARTSAIAMTFYGLGIVVGAALWYLATRHR